MINVGSADRAVRLVVGLVLLVVGTSPLWMGSSLIPGLGVWNWVVAAVGGIMMVTGLMRTCPAYSLLGINTCSRQ